MRAVLYRDHGRVYSGEVLPQSCIAPSDLLSEDRTGVSSWMGTSPFGRRDAFVVGQGREMTDRLICLFYIALLASLLWDALMVILL